jgi:hypothetical protein
MRNPKIFVLITIFSSALAAASVEIIATNRCGWDLPLVGCGTDRVVKPGQNITGRCGHADRLWSNADPKLYGYNTIAEVNVDDDWKIW